MTTDDGDDVLSPNEAFATLGNETRMAVLRALGEHGGGPLTFSELHDAVGMRDSGQFNYHLDQLVGHFVSRTDDGYELRRAGERVIEAVLSGAVTDDPVLERTAIDHACHYCGAPLEMSFRQESTATYCTECAGAFDQSRMTDELADEEYGFLGYLHLPPAGLKDRSPTEVHEAAFAWQLAENLPAAGGVCPRCSGPLEEEVQTCEDHHPGDGLCDECGNRHRVQYSAACTNCIYDLHGPFANKLLASTELLAFLTAHGFNPFSPSPERFGRVILDYEEELVSVEPFEARFTFAVDGDRCTLTVDEGLGVVAADAA